MRFFEVVLSGAALISAVLAVEFTSFPSSVKAGDKVTLTYIPKDATTTILLKKGLSTDLTTLETLTSTSIGGSFTWTVPEDLVNGPDYAFEIQQEGADPNYSSQFSLSGGAAYVSSASASASSSKVVSSSAGYSTAVSTVSSAASVSVSTTIKTSVIVSVTSVGSASATIIPSHGLNSTISTGSPSATTTSGSPSPTAGEPPVENTGAASAFGTNPVALFMGAFAAVAYFV